MERKKGLSITKPASQNKFRLELTVNGSCDFVNKCEIDAFESRRSIVDTIQLLLLHISFLSREHDILVTEKRFRFLSLLRRK